MLVVGFLAILCVIYVADRLVQWRRNANLAPLPPGPKGLPLVGNLRDLPEPGVLEAEHWAKLAEYGPISSITIMGNTLIFVNDAQMAIDMLDKRATYSSRAVFNFAGDIGWSKTTAALKYNNTLRAHRKNFARIMGTKALASQYHSLQEAEVAYFLQHVLDNPESLRDHIKRQAGSIILKVVYGYNAEQEKRDPLIDMIQQCTEDLSSSGVPGAFLVDIIPSLRYVPDWVPGTGWKKLARKWAYELNLAIETPFAFVQRQLAEGRENNSFVANLLKNSENTAEDAREIKWGSSSLYSGGADTQLADSLKTVSTVACFFLAMTMFPEVQAKAQAEIDRVVGTERLPTLDDRDSLPYVEAIMKETLRWHSVVPTALPHTADEDTIYAGYRIPKDTMIMPNVWWFTHDPSIYPEPNEFRPERYLESPGHEPGTDPRKFVFGFGRRICAGKTFAENTLFLDFVQSLAVFNIRKKSVDGHVVEPQMKSLPGAISHLAPYETCVEARSPHHEKMIRALAHKYPWQESDGETLKRIGTPKTDPVPI
ncbi:cytochrome p450 oxidoreductase [Colletotrichum chrysophilum]|uniref:Cytochrome p450 oxidoreductase n=1 Tax=Colletotrichum chrysophilum TaxID=1836956 RepID=A0AAD9AT28_9PEZI|nr:cytochrome p450 oxidoreductase [Colletotrichum chrysophilum]